MNVTSLDVSVYVIPTNGPEADGTIHWDSTTMVLVQVGDDAGHHGLGFSYASRGAATVIHEKLREVVLGCRVEDPSAAWRAMVDSVRNMGRPGVCSTAIAAVDIALWDLKARAAGQPLFRLLGPFREEVPIYGSGGFTTYSVQRLVDQLAGWVHEGIPRVKMKVGMDWGTKPEEDIKRVQAVREAIGPDAELMVDANGGYRVKEAVRIAKRYAELGVTYFEEPVSSDQLHELAFIRGQTPIAIAAGEYAYDPWYVRDMLRAGAVDIQQADITRCLGVTGWLQAADIAYGFATPFSGHTAPSIHAQAGCAAPQLSHIEYFYDHVRIENMFFEGVPQPVNGHLRPDPNRPGLGLDFKRADAEQYRVG